MYTWQNKIKILLISESELYFVYLVNDTIGMQFRRGFHCLANQDLVNQQIPSFFVPFVVSDVIFNKCN